MEGGQPGSISTTTPGPTPSRRHTSAPNGATTNGYADNNQHPDEIEEPSTLSDRVAEVEEGKPIARMLFVSSAFEAICSVEEDEVNAYGEMVPGKCRPLVAIDFGRATWTEYVPQPGRTKVKQLRFVSFSLAIMDENGVTKPKKGEEGTFGWEGETEGRVKTGNSGRTRHRQGRDHQFGPKSGYDFTFCRRGGGFTLCCN